MKYNVDFIKECFSVNICNACGLWKVVIDIKDSNQLPEGHEPEEHKSVCPDCISQASNELFGAEEVLIRLQENLRMAIRYFK